MMQRHAMILFLAECVVVLGAVPRIHRRPGCANAGRETPASERKRTTGYGGKRAGVSAVDAAASATAVSSACDIRSSISAACCSCTG